MFDIERWEEIFEAISKNKLRTFLTGLSVGSGIFILIILLGIGNGMKNGIQSKFEEDSASLIVLWTEATSMEYKGLNENRKIDFTLDDFNYAGKRYKSEVAEATTRYRRWGALTTYKKESGSYALVGAMPDMLSIENASLNAGRFISEDDLKNNAKVTCIGIQVAYDLFKDYNKAVGEYIQANNIQYKVIGVYSDPGGERDNTKLFVPRTTMAQIYNNKENVGELFYTLTPESNFDKTNEKSEKFLSQFKSYLRKKHNVHPDDLKAIQSHSSLDEAKKFINLNRIMSLFFWGIGILTLIAGIVGVSNIMLIIVKERTKEIGIRKALGAQPGSIITMILHESIFITTISGFIGLFLSLALLQFAGPEIKSEFILNPSVNFGVAVTTVILLIVAGAIAGYLPARHASKIKPIIALRDE
ncbi:ABC transporter permease [Aquimarina agarivorans]|uniref:ABC transporter permease n=1 Tax=Aquimarina agarivorans TaxID=980584 RepID=UPI000248ED17|nr:ABC transporter permease [Aquimarina agarivorans]